MCLGFITTGYLISLSYNAWEVSPVATSITTHPISSLTFPTVTVCPPKGSHTAINQDLSNADNASLTETDREGLKMTAADIFIQSSHVEYIESMKLAAPNLRQIYQGFQSLPLPYRESGFQVTLWDTSGSWQTPHYGEQANVDFYKEDKLFRVILQFPDNLEEEVGEGSLVVELDIDVRNEEGWEENVAFLDGTKYRLYSLAMVWESAEAHCVMEGGHLASVVSQGDQDKVVSMLGPMGQQITVWIGGTDLRDKRRWRWSDGSPWSFTGWIGKGWTMGNGHSCVVILSTGDWIRTSCSDRYPFLCTQPTFIREPTKLTLEYTQDQLTFPSFQVWYRYRGIQTEQSVLSNRMTGFRINWFIQDKNGTQSIQAGYHK